MAKKPKPAASKVATADKEVLYIVVDPSIKRDMERIAKAHERKVTGEVIVALRQYIAAHDADQ